MFCFFVCFSTTLLSGTTRCSGFILHISCPSPRISHFSKKILEPFLFLFCTLSHTLAVLFSHIIVVSLSLSLSHALSSLFMLLPLVHSCSPIPFCICVCVCVCLSFQSQRVISLDTQSTPEQKNKKILKFFLIHNKMPLSPRLSRVISENS